MVQAEITRAGTADTLPAAHVARTRRDHQVTKAALYSIGLTITATEIQNMSLWCLMNGDQRGKTKYSISCLRSFLIQAFFREDKEVVLTEGKGVLSAHL